MGQITVDTVTSDPASGEWALYIVEDGPWPDSEADWERKLRKLQDRLYSAVEVAIDGHLAAKYPESRGKDVRIQLDSPSGCPARVQQLVDAFRRTLETSAEWHDAIDACTDIGGLRVVTGHELGRFGPSSEIH